MIELSQPAPSFTIATRSQRLIKIFPYKIRLAQLTSLISLNAYLIEKILALEASIRQQCQRFELILRATIKEHNFEPHRKN